MLTAYIHGINLLTVHCFLVHLQPKCEDYLPEHYGVYGDIEVTVAKIIQKKGYVVRHLHLKVT